MRYEHENQKQKNDSLTFFSTSWDKIFSGYRENMQNNGDLGLFL